MSDKLLLLCLVFLAGTQTGSAVVVIHKDGTETIFPHMPGLFGQNSGYNVHGNLSISSRQPHACHSIYGDQLDGTILLTKRFQCDFIDKAYNAQRANASALIIGDKGNRRTWVAMQTNKVISIHIPVVFMLGVDHEELRKMYFRKEIDSIILDSRGERLYKPPRSGTRMRFFTPVLFLLLFSTLPIVWIIRGVVAGLVRAIQRRLNQQRFINYATTIPEQKYQETATSEDDIEGQPDEKNETDVSEIGASINATCVVCLEDFRDGEFVKVLPCRHGFHTPCIMQWFERSHSCPVCKRRYNQHQASLLRIFRDRYCSCCPPHPDDPDPDPNAPPSNNGYAPLGVSNAAESGQVMEDDVKASSWDPAPGGGVSDASSRGGEGMEESKGAVLAMTVLQSDTGGTRKDGELYSALELVEEAKVV